MELALPVQPVMGHLSPTFINGKDIDKLIGAIYQSPP